MPFDARAAAQLLMDSPSLDGLLAEARRKHAGVQPAPASTALDDARKLQASIDQTLMKRAEARSAKVAAVRRMLHLCSRLDPVC